MLGVPPIPGGEHVDAWLAGDENLPDAEAERRFQASAGPVGCGGEHPDAPGLAAVQEPEQALQRDEARQERALHGGRGVQPDALERDAVPELHDHRRAWERTRGGVPVDVAEAVRDHDHSGPGGRPPAAQTALRDRPDAEFVRIASLALGPRQPERLETALHGRVPQGEGAVADAGAAPDHPAPPPRDDEGSQPAEQIQRILSSLPALPARKEKDATP